MKPYFLGLLAMWLLAANYAHGSIRRDLRNIQVAQMDGEYKIDYNAKEIVFIDRESSFEDVLRCQKDSGKLLTYTEDEEFIACCTRDQTLLGSEDTAFDCCYSDQHLTGSHKTGYRCCPKGQIYDGTCHDPKPNCIEGKILMNGKCICPSTMVETHDGHCRPLYSPVKCEPDVYEGRCYILRMDNGLLLGQDKNGHYSTSVDSYAHSFGKFRFCKTMVCDGKSAINPDEEIHVLDMHGQYKNGENGAYWIDKGVRGDPLGTTPSSNNAGSFSITKWELGKHCMSGFKQGLVSKASLLVFTTPSSQACLPMTLIEVPCDIYDPTNNCRWTKGPDRGADKLYAPFVSQFGN